MGYLKSVGSAVIYIGLFFAVITFLPGIPPQVEFSEYRIKEPSQTKLQLEIKNRLKGAEVLYAGELKGAESFASYNGELYTGIRGGYVVKVDGKDIIPVVKFGQKCDGLWQEEKCGRPLGLQFNDKGELFVADAYYGIFKVNVNTRQFTNIVNSSKPIDGKPSRIVNSIDIAKNGDIYWTDSSTDFPLHDGSYTAYANPTGRLIRYNAATKKNEVLLKNLAFANGVLLADDESFVIVNECFRSRIMKYHLKGPKTGKSEIFAEALPGVLDNIHTDGQGGFLVSVITYADSEHPLLIHSLAPHPYLRKMIARFFYLIEAPFKVLQDVYPNYYAERVIYSVGSFESVKGLDTKEMSVVLRLDKAGNILEAIASDDQKVNGISSAYIHNGYLWLGSPWNENIMRVPLKQAFPQLKENKKLASEKQQKEEEESILTVSNTPNMKVNVKPSKAKATAQETTPKPTAKPATPKPTATTPKPTTTTQKPTTTTTTPKPTTTAATPKPTTATPKPTTTAPKPTTQKTVTEQKRPPTTEKPPPSKAPIKEVKKENSKEMKTENSKEAKKESSTSNVNTKTTSGKTDSAEKNQEDKVKSKSGESAKKATHEAQPGRSKPVEKNSDSVKK